MKMNNAEQAKGLLVHYFEHLFRVNRITFDRSNQREIEAIIDLIIKAAKA
jgi:hypothetical protein